MNKYLFGLTIILSLSASSLLGQVGVEILINNRSFEDSPRMGTNDARVAITDWYDCGTLRFKGETPPDIHPGKFWNVDLPASNGETYIGMVVRDNDSWEGVSQRLVKNIEAGKCYSFSVELAQSPQYISKSRMTMVETNYDRPAVFRLWAGNGFCNDKQLLAESKPIDYSFWKKYQFKIKPAFDAQYIMIEAFYKTPVFLPYCGHILLDNLSNFEEINCDEEIVAVVDSDLKQVPKTPPHKRSRVEQAIKEAEKPIAKETPKDNPSKKILEDLDAKKLKTGSIVEIKTLNFKADTSSIDPHSYEVLDEIFDFLKQNPKIVVEIGGHTNGIPPPDYCDKLSEERAKAVYDYLIQRGINSSKLSYKGYGKRKRIANDLTADGRKKNQRVEIKVLSLG